MPAVVGVLDTCLDIGVLAGDEMSASWKDVIDRPEKQKEQSQKYYARYKCHNCGKEDNLLFSKGTLAPQKMFCPKCECPTMEKVKK